MSAELDRFGLRMVAVGDLKTSLARLRSKRPSPCEGLTPAPIRVVPDPHEPERYEVVDGFKRLAAMREAGMERVVVLVEPVSEGLSTKWQAAALMLVCNAPKRTLTAMDEARVVLALVEEEKLSVSRIARLLARRKSWVSKRVTVARRLAAELVQELDAGRLALSLAYALCKLRKGEQVRVYRCTASIGLCVREALRLLQAYQALDDPSDREALLHEPRSFLEPPRASHDRLEPLDLCAAVHKRLATYHKLVELLEEIESESPLEDISPDQARLLDAERRRLEARIREHVFHEPQAKPSCIDPNQTSQENSYEPHSSTSSGHHRAAMGPGRIHPDDRFAHPVEPARGALRTHGAPTPLPSARTTEPAAPPLPQPLPPTPPLPPESLEPSMPMKGEIP
jgi:ParB/RepB/Spo0J family partition protein